MRRPSAMHPNTWKAYIASCFEAGINPEFGTRPNKTKGARIMQIIGDAAASAGYHARDAFYNLLGKEIPYCAAIDIRSTDLSEDECERFQRVLMKNGFAAWWRKDGAFANNQHFHVVHLGVAMKRQLRGQAHSFFDRKSGLVGNKDEKFLQDEDNLSEATLQKSRVLFLSHNRMNGAEIDIYQQIYPKDLGDGCADHGFSEDDEGVYGDIDVDNEE